MRSESKMHAVLSLIGMIAVAVMERIDLIMIAVMIVVATHLLIPPTQAAPRDHESS